MKLLPCPFCGGEAEIERYGTHRYSTKYQCTECGCELETGEEWDHGKRWNERYWAVADTVIPVENIDETVEALHQIINSYGEQEGYVPTDVFELYEKHHKEWEKQHHPEWFKAGESKPMEEKHIWEKIEDIREKVSLESAKEAAMARGKEWAKNYAKTPREKVIMDMAAYIYEHLEGYDQGRPTFEELTNPEKLLYVHAARFSYNLAMWSKGIDPKND
jgi:hypothetical protein